MKLPKENEVCVDSPLIVTQEIIDINNGINPLSSESIPVKEKMDEPTRIHTKFKNNILSREFLVFFENEITFFRRVKIKNENYYVFGYEREICV